MGFFDNIKAIKDVQTLKQGGTANLSIAQITNIITNMPDARKNLSPAQFEEVYALFKELSKCKTKINMDMQGYFEVACDIITEFDQIAPYEKYSGGNELEFSFLMKSIRKNYDPLKKHTDILKAEIDSNKDYQGYMEMISSQLINYGLSSSICENDTYELMMVILSHEHFGKEEALKRFDILANRIIDTRNPMHASLEVCFFAGALFPNGVVSKAESDELSKRYSDMAMEKMK